MVLNEAQKAVLEKMSKEKQEQFLKRDKERDKKEKEAKKKLEDIRKKEKDDYNEKWLEKYREMFSKKVLENIKLKTKLEDAESLITFLQIVGGINFTVLLFLAYNAYYDFKYNIKIPKEGLKPGSTNTFTMPGP